MGGIKETSVGKGPPPCGLGVRSVLVALWASSLYLLFLCPCRSNHSGCPHQSLQVRTPLMALGIWGPCSVLSPVPEMISNP